MERDLNKGIDDGDSSSSSNSSSATKDEHERKPPVFFTKPVFDGVVVAAAPGGSTTSSFVVEADDNKSEKNIAQVKYPPGTNNLHHEVELVVAIGKDAKNDEERSRHTSSRNYTYYIDPSESSSYIFGFGIGVDLTRRDLQSMSKSKGQPWDTGKYFDQSTPLSPISSVVVFDVFDGRGGDGSGESCSMGSTDKSSYVDEILQRLQSEPQSSLKGTTTTKTKTAMIQLSVNGQIKQRAPLHTMIWNIEGIISELSKYYQLKKGDLIMTGTPSGVGPVVVGDHVVGQIIFEEEEEENNDDNEQNDDDDNGEQRPPNHQDVDEEGRPGRFYIEPVEFVVVE